MAFCTVISDADGWSSIALYGKECGLLRRFLPFVDGTLNHNQLGILFSRLDLEQFQRCFMKWATGLQGTPAGVIAIDGKTSRRSFDNGSGKPAIHTISA